MPTNLANLGPRSSRFQVVGKDGVFPAGFARVASKHIIRVRRVGSPSFVLKQRFCKVRVKWQSALGCLSFGWVDFPRYDALLNPNREAFKVDVTPLQSQEFVSFRQGCMT